MPNETYQPPTVAMTSRSESHTLSQLLHHSFADSKLITQVPTFRRERVYEICPIIPACKRSVTDPIYWTSISTVLTSIYSSFLLKPNQTLALIASQFCLATMRVSSLPSKKYYYCTRIDGICINLIINYFSP